MRPSGQLRAFRNHGASRAIVFVHGYMGHLEQTWGRFPELIVADPRLASWDVWSFGYTSSSRPDFLAPWKRPARIQDLALLLFSRLTVSELLGYSAIALIGKSDGGLIIQCALLDYPDLLPRVSHVLLLATPSAGTKQAAAFKFFQRRFADMAQGSTFITGLRQRWADRFGAGVPFVFRVLAGEEDAFVPVESSLLPFPRQYWLMLPGDHFTIALPESESSENFVAVRNLLAGEAPPKSAEQAVKGIAAMEQKLVTGDFDVFLCHNSSDKPEVKKIAAELKRRGILPWLDEEQLRPGTSWQTALEAQIGKIRSVAVFVGKSGVGPWQRMEQMAFIDEFVNRGLPVIPVILPDSPGVPDLPLLLRQITWVDFRHSRGDAIDRLIWGITGQPDA